jgi:hypothetical protein
MTLPNQEAALLARQGSLDDRVTVTEGAIASLPVFGQLATMSSVDTAHLSNDAVTYAKLQNASATSVLLARKTAGAGDFEECSIADVLNFIASSAQGDVLYRDGSGWTRLPAGTSGQKLKTLGAASNPAWVDDVVSIAFVIDGGGAVLTTGAKGYLDVPFACTILAWRIIADAAGSCVVDVWKKAGAVPTVADTIAAAAKPTLTAAQLNTDTTLTGWTTSVAAGDILGFNVDSATTVQRVTVQLKVKRT